MFVFWSSGGYRMGAWWDELKGATWKISRLFHNWYRYIGTFNFFIWIYGCTGLFIIPKISRSTSDRSVSWITWEVNSGSSVFSLRNSVVYRKINNLELGGEFIYITTNSYKYLRSCYLLFPIKRKVNPKQWFYVTNTCVNDKNVLAISLF